MDATERDARLRARWALRAEEYRAIADAMRDRRARDAFERLAASCERQAAVPRNGIADRSQCLANARECEEFARKLLTSRAQRAVLNVAERWRTLAARFDRDRKT
jgi:hypothetical protein